MVRTLELVALSTGATPQILMALLLAAVVAKPTFAWPLAPALRSRAGVRLT